MAIVILLSLVFGIVIDTFAELREAAHKKEDDIKNICFICGGRKEDLEKQNIKFQKHITTKHDLWVYVEYMLSLKYIDLQETNSINTYVMSMLEQRSISWFPSFKNSY